MITNTILATDSYKASHWLQYPPGTEYVYSYVESRGGSYDRTVFFGLQAFLRRYLSQPVTQADIEEAAEFFAAHGEPFHREGWEHILTAHRGRLPVEIKAAPEGLAIGVHNVLLTIVNTDPRCYWLPSYLETALLRAIWYPTTVCTVSFYAKVAILQALARSSDAAMDGAAAFKLHDFGARGSTSQESAALAGMAHLVNFMGTDTVEGVLAARRCYDEPMAGFSIPAAEHSTITAWGRAGEVDAYRNMLRQFAKPGSSVAVVSDSYDLMQVVGSVWGGVLKQTILDRRRHRRGAPGQRRPIAGAGGRAAGVGCGVRQQRQQQGLPGSAAPHPRDPGRRHQRAVAAAALAGGDGRRLLDRQHRVRAWAADCTSCSTATRRSSR